MVSAEASIRRALALLGAASNDWCQKGPSDGSTPLYWPAAVTAARAHLAHTLTALEAPGAAQKSPASDADAKLGILWWNGLSERERAQWLRVANSAVPADAWQAFQQHGPAAPLRGRHGGARDRAVRIFPHDNKENDHMAKSKAVALMRAGEKARRAEQRVADAQRALAKAEKARDRADANYMDLVRASIADQVGTGTAGGEVAPQSA